MKALTLIATLIIVLSLSGQVSAAMFETFSPQLGDINMFRTDSSFEPYNIDNNIVLIKNGYSLASFDIEKNRIVDFYKFEMPYKVGSLVFIQKPDGNSYVYIWFDFNQNKLGKLDLNKNGEFSNFEILKDDFPYGKIIADK